MNRLVFLSLVAACGHSAPLTERGPELSEPPPGGLRASDTRPGPDASPLGANVGRAVAADPREVHLRNLHQLTFSGENAEAYFSPDGSKLIYQARQGGGDCDQQFVFDLATGDITRVSSGHGRTTCGYFGYPGGDFVVFSSTEHVDHACPTEPDRSHGYVWGLFDFDIYRANPDGTGLERLLGGPSYDAEATVRFSDGRIVFTSDRDGDLDLYTMAADGTDLRRITHTPGYDGGAFFSPDGSKLVYRAHHPAAGPALDEYRALLAQRMVRPSRMEIFVSNADGTSARQVTSNGAANFAPYFMPDNRHVIFASNVGGSPREFDLFIVDTEAPPNADGDRPLERVTFAEGFDGFPMFSPVGPYFVFASNRLGAAPGDTNLFLAEWVP